MSTIQEIAENIDGLGTQIEEAQATAEGVTWEVGEAMASAEGLGATSMVEGLAAAKEKLETVVQQLAVVKTSIEEAAAATRESGGNT